MAPSDRAALQSCFAAEINSAPAIADVRPEVLAQNAPLPAPAYRGEPAAPPAPASGSQTLLVAILAVLVLVLLVVGAYVLTGRAAPRPDPADDDVVTEEPELDEAVPQAPEALPPRAPPSTREVPMRPSDLVRPVPTRVPREAAPPAEDGPDPLFQPIEPAPSDY